MKRPPTLVVLAEALPKPWQTAYLGSIAAACQVGRLGIIPLTPNDLIKEIEV